MAEEMQPKVMNGGNYGFLFFRIIITTILACLAIYFLLIHQPVQPRDFDKFYVVNEVIITRISYTSSSNTLLHYNLVLDFTVSNRNGKSEGSAFIDCYTYTRFGEISDDDDFKEDKKRSDIFYFDLQIRFIFGDHTKAPCFDCELKVPALSFNGTTVPTFQPTECVQVYSCV